MNDTAIRHRWALLVTTLTAAIALLSMTSSASNNLITLSFILVGVGDLLIIYRNAKNPKNPPTAFYGLTATAVLAVLLGILTDLGDATRLLIIGFSFVVFFIISFVLWGYVTDAERDTRTP
ncbi:hypothetical protein [Corynebacterium aquilae]|uniref:Uncharacterized protein n=1 Tax=Corynebacterium aquilae DSM 44791 TaxID=1431546 RepID=A0A1L7CD38_9CORY|nr:hypothetical protein [Corynebacterium aquilae]APT83759.1 hypothetical protein CAQU_00125 [Corynebacterium aquilae DSM 44791]